METYIYTLADETGVRYVGKADILAERFRNHLKECTRRRTRKECWIYGLKMNGQQPIMEVLEVIDGASWSDAEMYWIAQLRAWGFDLVNGTDGGEGSNGFKGKRHSEETKEKCRIAANMRVVVPRLSGSTNGRSVLTEDMVKQIKSRLSEPSRKLAAEFGVSKTTIGWIKSGKKWGHIVA